MNPYEFKRFNCFHPYLLVLHLAYIGCDQMGTEPAVRRTTVEMGWFSPFDKDHIM